MRTVGVTPDLSSLRREHPAVALGVFSPVVPPDRRVLDRRQDRRARLLRGVEMGVDVLDADPDAVDHERNVRPASGGVALLAMPPRALVVRPGITEEHDAVA